MGNASRPDLHPRVAAWGQSFISCERRLDGSPTCVALARAFEYELKEYFRLCALARGRFANRDLAISALGHLFRVRVVLERSLIRAIESSLCKMENRLDACLEHEFFGRSKKQGISLRMPLATCQPSRLCGPACYAHDVLDASPYAVIRGSMDGWIANCYEKGDEKERVQIIERLESHIKRAVKKAIAEVDEGKPGSFRRPRIRFAHVGEIAEYPIFANALAVRVREVSRGGVDCVVYTRHEKARELDPAIWIINFTIDKSSEDRRSLVPPSARTVYSAFGGELSEDAAVNFLEHHRHFYCKAVGKGQVCPVTANHGKIASCDQARCDLCFMPITPGSP